MKINKIYTDKNVFEEMKKTISEELVIALPQFFENKLDIIKEKLKKTPFITKYKPLEHKYQELELTQVYDIDLIQFVEFFKSKEFLQFIEDMTDFDLRISSVHIRKYTHTDFVLLSDNQKNDDCFDITFDLSDKFSTKMGGMCVYATNEEEILYLSPASNILTILYKSPSIKKYLKYLNARAKGLEMYRVEITAEFIEENLIE